MPSNYNNALRLEIIGNGEQAGNWGNTTNINLGTLLVQAITGVENVTMAGNTTLTVGNGVADQARNAVLILGGTLASPADLIVPSDNKVYIVRNATANGQTVTVKTAAGTGVALQNGYTQLMYCDGTNVTAASQSLNPAVAPGTVSSVTLATTGTGLTVNGGNSANITTSGTFTLAGTLDVDNGGTGLNTLPSQGRFPISNGTSYASGTVASGNAISAAYNPATNNIVIDNDGVTSLTAGSGILLSGSTGNITITSTGGGGSSGVTSFSAGSTGFSPSVATPGQITLTGFLLPGSGGTGLQGFGTQNQALYSTSASTLTAGTLPPAAGGTGLTTFTSPNQALYSTSSSVLVAGTLPVAAGGTGATTLTGYVKGAGTSALTTVATIPVADISGTIGVSSGGTGATTLSGYLKGNGTLAVSGTATIPISDLTGTLAVSNGGTGATTLSGYLKGNGTSAVSGAATIPVADITGTLGVANGGTGTTTAFTTGAVVFAGASGVYSQDPTQLFWDATNNRLGIGNASPTQALTVTGSSIASGTSYFTDTSYYAFVTSTTAYLNFDSGDWLEYQRSANKLVAYMGSNPKFAVESSGNLQFDSGYGSVATAYGCRAWVSFNGTASPPTISGQGNISSIGDLGVGTYRLNFTNAMTDANYSVLALARNNDNSGPGLLVSPNLGNGKSALVFDFNVWDGSALVDSTEVNMAVFR
jgi:hypothetical protein